MYTKAYLTFMKCFQQSDSMCGFFKAKDVGGTDRYISPFNYTGTSLSNYPGRIHTKKISSSNDSDGVNFSDIQTPFVDGEDYTYIPIPNLYMQFISSSTSGTVVGEKLSTTYRFSITNNSANSVTLYKYYQKCILGVTDSALGTSPSSRTFLAMVKELDSPITIPASGDAIVDITIETEIQE